MSDLPPRARPVDYIIEMVALHYGMPKEVIVNKGKRGAFVEARQVAMMLAKEMLPDVSLLSMAKVFHRDHSTVHHAISRGQALVLGDTETAMRVKALRERLVHDLGVADEVRDKVLRNMLNEAVIAAKTHPQDIAYPLQSATVNSPPADAMSSVEGIEV